ncbi:hypothetical protein H632_c1305p0 [Helicosporidium sp. ATCC 50920]|nr:hypothetical protein H632_c1305p0 [Helicosporidium sp. ATCC 50920]|eukprot:KDD74448.1 hypothetical protein H632_c1305p0 [Helicosporidium sp. ATCC 50920]
MAKFSALAKIQSSSVAQDGAETAIKLLECPSASGEPAEEACDEASMAMMHEAGTGLSEEQLLEVFKQTSIFNVRTALAGNEALWEIDDMMEMAAERSRGSQAKQRVQALVRRRVRWRDPDDILMIRIPNPLPLAWGRTVVFKQAASWGLVYVENLTWVFRAPDHSILRLPAHYAALSHLSLYMFRSTDRSRDLDLRHQRSPDVVFDCRTSAQGTVA